MTDLTLYWLVPNDRSNRVRWLLRELEVEFAEQQLDASAGEHRQGDYLDVNPFGKVPAIVTEGLTLSESGAIILYLLDRYDTDNDFAPRREADLWPAFLQWLFWGLTTLENAVIAYINDPGEKQAAAVKRFVEPLEQKFSSNEFLLGQSFSAADIVCGYDLGLLSRTFDLAAWPSVRAYLSRLLARPAAASFASAIDWSD